MLIRGPLYRPDPVWLLPDVPVPGCALPIALELPLDPVEVRLDEVPPPDELSGAFRRLLTCGVRNPGGGVRSDESPPVADPPAAPGCRDVPPVTDCDEEPVDPVGPPVVVDEVVDRADPLNADPPEMPAEAPVPPYVGAGGPPPPGCIELNPAGAPPPPM